MSMMEDKDVLKQMLEREAGNLYESARSIALNLANTNPAIKIVFQNYLKANESNWIEKLQEQVDLLVEGAYINPNITLEQALNNANSILNATIKEFLKNKLGLSSETINITLQLLLGIS